MNVVPWHCFHEAILFQERGEVSLIGSISLSLCIFCDLEHAAPRPAIGCSSFSFKDSAYIRAAACMIMEVPLTIPKLLFLAGEPQSFEGTSAYWTPPHAGKMLSCASGMHTTRPVTDADHYLHESRKHTDPNLNMWRMWGHRNIEAEQRIKWYKSFTKRRWWGIEKAALPLRPRTT